MVNEEAVCGHMSQGLFLKNPNDSQMEGVEAGRPAERLGSLPVVGDRGSSVAEEEEERVIRVHSEEAHLPHPPVLAGGSGEWVFREEGLRPILRLRGDWRKLPIAEVGGLSRTPSSCKGRVRVRFGPNSKGQTYWTLKKANTEHVVPRALWVFALRERYCSWLHSPEEETGQNGIP